MDNADKTTLSHSSGADTGLVKTFLIGAATPLVSVACLAIGKNRPEWLTKEFGSSVTRPLKNICFAFGLATGVAGITGSVGLVGEYVMDEYLVASRANNNAGQTSAHKTHIPLCVAACS